VIFFQVFFFGEHFLLFLDAFIGGVVEGGYGLIESFKKRKEKKMLIFGIDGVGKTCLFSKMFTKEWVSTVPTIGVQY